MYSNIGPSTHVLVSKGYFLSPSKSFFPYEENKTDSSYSVPYSFSVRLSLSQPLGLSSGFCNVTLPRRGWAVCLLSLFFPSHTHKREVKRGNETEWGEMTNASEWGCGRRRNGQKEERFLCMVNITGTWGDVIVVNIKSKVQQHFHLWEADKCERKVRV